MREQKGYVFHKGKSWFVRYCDDVIQPDRTIKRKLVCKKLDVEYGGEYRTRKSVQPFVDGILKPINAGTIDARSTMSVAEFVEQKYFPQYVAALRPSTRKGYRIMWDTQLKNRRECALALRDFRTIHGQNLLSNIARQTGLSKNYLKHIKSFLSGVFAEARRLDVLNTVNPMQGTKLPAAPEPEDTHAHGLGEIKAMLAVLGEPAWTVILCAALSGLRKGEIRGLTWADFDGKELSVRHSVWNSEVTEPKTARSRAPIPVVKQLAEALEAHKLRAGILAQPGLPIFQAGNGKPLNLDNLVRRVIRPALERCAACRKPKDEHKTEGHLFEQDKSLPQWHGWHSFRRGLATNLHELGIADKEIQAILRHSNIGLTMNIYVKSVSKSQVNAMDTLSEKFGTCSNLATTQKEPVN